MSSGNKKWLCSVNGCTQNDRVCDRMAGVDTNPSEEIKFIKDPVSESHYCDPYMQWLVDSAKVLQNSEGENGTSQDNSVLLTPSVIFSLLEQRIHGQSKACRMLATSVFKNIAKRSLRGDEELLADYQLESSDIGKTNVIIVGPTGCGKTYLVKTIANIINEPLLIYAGTAGLTQAGYVGKNVEDIITEFFPKVQEFMNDNDPGSGDDPHAVATWINQNGGMIALDEIDKLAATKGSFGQDVNGEGVQDRLLTFFEGEQIPVKIPTGNGYVTVTVDTTNIQFIMMGAFSPADSDVEGDTRTAGVKRKSLAEIVEEDIGVGNQTRSSKEVLVGDNTANILYHANATHIMKFGFSPQFVGRIGSIVPLRQFNVDDFLKILSGVKGNMVSLEKARFEVMGKDRGLSGFDLILTNEALEVIAAEAAKIKAGARGLRQVLESTLSEVDYMAPDLVGKELNEVLITPEVVKKRGAIIEEGPNKTFRKSKKPRLVRVKHKPALLAPPKGTDVEDVD